MSFRWLAPVLTEMDERDVAPIVEAARRIVRRVGMTIDGTEEFFDYLRNFGCEVRGTHVHFPDAVIDTTMARIEAVKRENVRAARAYEPSSEVTWSTSGQALWCCDPETDRLRPATKKDLAALSHVIDSVEGLGRTHPTFIPQDAPARTRELHAFVTIILNSREPHRVSAYSVEIVKYFVDAMTVVYGSEEEARKRLLLPCKVWLNSPFMISREDIEAPMELRRLTGQPLTINSMPVAGAATPVTPAGALAQITAEVIAANVISLAVDGRIEGWIAGPLSFDMKTGVHTQWGPETIFLLAGASHVSAYLFGGRPRFSVTTSTAAKVPGAQSMMEKAFAMGLGFALGARSFGALTTLAFSDVGSVVQLMLELELVSAIRDLAKGFEVDPERIAEEVICEVAPKGAYYLGHEHTFRHFRDVQWFPELADRRITAAWMQDPSTMLEHARRKALHLLETAPNQCTLEDAQRRELQRILDAADRELG